MIVQPWKGERRNPPGDLARDAKRLATGRQHCQARAVSQQRLDEMRDRRHQVLTVVEQKQLLAIADVSGDRDLRGAIRGKPRLQGLGDRRADQLGLPERGQLHRPHAGGEIAGPLARQLQREPRLAAATCPRQRQQPRLTQQRGGLGQLTLAADEATELPREVVRALGQPSFRARGAWARRLPLARAAREYLPVEAAGLLVGLVVELAPQTELQLLELRQRLLPPPGPHVEIHQRPMRGLVQRRFDQHRSQTVDRRSGIVWRLELRQLDPQNEAKLADGFAPRCRPLFVTVLRQQLAVVGVKGVPVGDRIAARSRCRCGLLESEHVDPHRIIGTKRDHVLVQLQTLAALEPGRVKRPSRRKNRLVQIIPSGGIIAPGPEVARLPSPRASDVRARARAA